MSTRTSYVVRFTREESPCPAFVQVTNWTGDDARGWSSDDGSRSPVDGRRSVASWAVLMESEHESREDAVRTYADERHAQLEAARALCDDAFSLEGLVCPPRGGYQIPATHVHRPARPGEMIG